MGYTAMPKLPGKNQLSRQLNELISFANVPNIFFRKKFLENFALINQPENS